MRAMSVDVTKGRSHHMKKLIHAAIAVAVLTGSALSAQQPTPQPRQPGAGGPPPANGEAPQRREGPPGGPGDRMGRGMPGMPGMPGMQGMPGMRMAIYSPTALLEKREALALTADQVTKLSTLENDLRAAREKAATDAKPHRDELAKLWEQSVPDVAQIRTHAQAMMQVEQTAQLAALLSTAQAKAVLTPEQRGRVQGWAEAGGPEGRGGPRGQMFRRQGPGPQGPGAPRRPGFGFRPGSASL